MTKQRKYLCPECGNRTAAEVLGCAEDLHWYYVDETDENSAMSVSFYYEVVKCITCSGIQLFHYEEDFDGDLDNVQLLYPETRLIQPQVPSQIAHEFAEALKVERVSRTAFAVLVGRVLERLFIDKGAVGERMYDQIKDLSGKGVIPYTLCEMSHTLRFLRNKGAHVSEYEIDKEEVEAMKDFVTTLLEYVYVAPSKLAALKATIESKKKGRSPKPEGE
jgi:hypothetical protein